MRISAILAALVLLATIAAGPPDAAHAALLTVVENSGDYGCSPGQLPDAIADHSDIRTIGNIGGHRVILANIEAPCLCGTINCPWYVVQLDPSGPRVLYSTYAYIVIPISTGEPLPELRSRAHDSARITVEDLSAYRKGEYVSLYTWRVDNATGNRKPDHVDVHFAPGTYSTVLHGNVSPGFGDDYRFAAVGGQVVQVSQVRSSRPLRFMILGANNYASPIDPGHPVTLPANGHYSFTVDAGNDNVNYSLEFAVRYHFNAS